MGTMTSVHPPRIRHPRTTTHDGMSWTARVVVAEDNDEMRKLVAAILRRDGYFVLEARDGGELIDRLREALRDGPIPAIDLVVSDVRMPGASGLEVLERLREVDWSIPVIMITAFGSPDTHAEAHRLGAATVLDKPFALEELRHAVRALVPPSI